MKKTSVIVILFLSAFYALGQSNIQQMDKAKWEEDLTFLMNKINKEFISNNHEIKREFNTKAVALRERIPHMSHVETAVAMGRLVAGLKDGHTEISLLQENLNFTKLPVYCYYIQNELYIVSAHQKYKGLIGKKIVQIGSTPIQEAYTKTTALLAHDNDMEFKHEAPNYLTLPTVLKVLGIVNDDTQVELTLEDENQTREVVTCCGCK